MKCSWKPNVLNIANRTVALSELEERKRCPPQSSNFCSVIKSSFIPTVFSRERTLSFCGSKNTFYKMYFN
ncbi:hypothetical protein TNIN_169391 [Trichonephila inaurata madagascariensis]|uniref:Uncharacterized protein n=1 Tax=Trichonephila inaurata madagascariensis TaxID=2747483 RepID=A0A8X6WTW0_9ARAC|nr:hypothetical protein TNIN_169391 [Trichonephila inaurata madagascariensis]